jgi:phosphoribosylaminoimidazolecarboxamide formyltransferase/IMP cyclohydrolase
MSDLVPVKRALLSVSDKSGLSEFATALHKEFAIELISTGGTARFLREAGLPVTDVSDLTGFPEMMDGRVKTLHPKVHGGLLALRDHPEHLAAMQKHGIQGIDLLCINLYPFQKTVAKPDVSFDEAIENIDIGGPAMIRSAAKNHRFVLVVTSPDRYDKVLGDLRQHGGASCAKHRLKQAQRAFAHTAVYDTAIAEYLSAQLDAPPDAGSASADRLSESLSVNLSKKQDLRYGENPHQKAAVYVDRRPGEASVAFATQHHGKELSYINLLDADGALACIKEFTQPAACIVKHTTPCGCAVAFDIATAFTRAFDGDPLAAFGGIVALNRTIDLAAAPRAGRRREPEQPEPGLRRRDHQPPRQGLDLVLSIMAPIAMAMPPSDMMLALIPSQRVAASATRMPRGSVAMATNALRAWKRKTTHTSPTMTPSSISVR